MNLVQAVYLNHAYEPLANETVRKALCYALDREQVFDVVADGHGTAVGSSIYPNFRKYFLPELADLYPHDTEKAKAMLAEAGYPNGFDLTITVPSNYQPHMDTAQVVADQLAHRRERDHRPRRVGELAGERHSGPPLSGYRCRRGRQHSDCPRHARTLYLYGE